MLAIIYDLQQHARHISASESHPRSLDIVGEENRTALDWTTETLRQYGVEEIIYVGDYHIEKVISKFPTIKVLYAGSSADYISFDGIEFLEKFDSSVLIIKASTIILPGALNLLTAGGVSYATDSSGNNFGIYYIPKFPHSEKLINLFNNFPISLFSRFQQFIEETYAAKAVCLDGLAAPVFDQTAVAGSIFRGKAQTLDNLAPMLKDAFFLPRERFNILDWRSDPAAIVGLIQKRFSPQMVVVRSSAAGEDGLNKSFAGKYLSILGVDSADADKLQQAIEKVIASYGNLEQHLYVDTEVLVQPQVRSVACSGVILTRDPRGGGPYFVISEDRFSGRTDSVTSGDTNLFSQKYIAWSTGANEVKDEIHARLIRLARELIRLSCLDALDIEYVIDLNGHIYLLQVRPLAAARKALPVVDGDTLDMIRGAKEFVATRMNPRIGIAGCKNVLGVMADWNPAEMIGLSPRPLALSLYQRLIGENSWSEARYRIGYKDVRSEPLILSVGGRPYVDIRASLNSFMPATLDGGIGSQLIDSYLDLLHDDHALHDKVEFDVAITCLAPDWLNARQRLDRLGIDADKLCEHLRPLTLNILNENVESIDDQLKKISQLKILREQLLSQDYASLHDKSRLIASLLNDCRNFGLVSFSILARYAFISMSFLRGFLETGIITKAQYDCYLQSIPTIASQIKKDLTGNISLELLIERYGHLRPNSYEITSSNYASNPSLYFRSKESSVHSLEDVKDEVLATSLNAMDDSLRSLGLDISITKLLSFISRSISGREFAKFEFMKSVNAILEVIELLGEDCGLDKSQSSFLHIDDFLRLQTDSMVRADLLQLGRRSAFNEKRWQVTSILQLPDVIFAPEDVEAFILEPWRANFVTNKRIVGRAVWLDEDQDCNIDGAVIIIRAADPGYDWVFSHPIAGLITEFGGAASHMAIRAAEFGLPAAIGCGSLIMESLRGASSIELDCAHGKVRPS